jgi:nitrate/nitrite-specific signal transduction histidine kinase
VLQFEQQATIARELHSSLARALARSKALLEQVRPPSVAEAETRAALQEVSHLLEGMAIESDRALRSLETASPDATMTSLPRAQRHALGKTHTPHDR